MKIGLSFNHWPLEHVLVCGSIIFFYGVDGGGWKIEYTKMVSSCTIRVEKKNKHLIETKHYQIITPTIYCRCK